MTESPKENAHASSRPRNMRNRLIMTLLALPLGLVATDLAVGKFYVDTGLYDGPPLPPFRILGNPHLKDFFKVLEGAKRRGIDSILDQRYDQELGWTLHPRQGGMENGRYVPRINAVGARSSHEYSSPIPPGKLRLACFGDSFTYCSEVEDQDAWPARLEEFDGSVEAINFGVPGYGTDQALLRYRRKSSDIDLDVVVIGLQAGSIARIVTRCRNIEQPTSSRISVKPRFRVTEGELNLVTLPFKSADELLACALAGELPKTLHDDEYWSGDDPMLSFSTIARIYAARKAGYRRRPPYIWNRPQEEPYKILIKILDLFRAEALANGAKEVLLLIFPEPGDFNRRQQEGVLYLNTFRKDLAAREFPVIDFDQRFHRLFKLDNSAMFMKHHFNPEANQLVAQEILEWIESRPELRAGKNPLVAPK